MRKKFITNLIFLLTINLLIKPYWIFGIDRVVQNKVGEAAYGTYFAVFNFSFILSIILDFGINNFNNRAVSRDNNRLGEYLLNLLMVKLFLSAIYFALTIICAIIYGYGALEMKMLFFWALNQILISATLYFRSNIAALQLFKTDSVVSILDRLIAGVFCLGLMYLVAFKDSFNIMWFIYAQTAGFFLTALIAFIIIARKSVLRFTFWKTGFTKMILLKSAPFAMLALLMGIYYRIDAVMIEHILPNGRKEAGIYAASFRLLDAVNQFGFLFSTLLLPIFASMIRKNEDLHDLVKFSSELMFVLAIVTAADCYFFRNEIMHLLYHNSTSYWSLIFGWLMLNFIPMSSIYIFGTLLTAQGSLKILNTIALGGMILNIVLNLYLIPRYGAFGATVATLITQAGAAIAHIMAAQQKFRFRYEIKDLLKLAGFTGACCLALFTVKLLPYGWMFNFIIASALCVLMAAVTRLVPLQDLYKLVRSRATS